MSMDNVFNSDEHDFISKPVSFKDFLYNAIQARSSLEKATSIFNDHNSNKENQRERISRFCGMTFKETQIITDEIESFIDNFKSSTEKAADFNLSNECLSSNLRTLKILKYERQKRKNRQYKSASFRILKYDRIDIKLVTQSRSRHDIQKINVQSYEDQSADMCLSSRNQAADNDPSNLQIVCKEEIEDYDYASYNNWVNPSIDICSQDVKLSARWRTDEIIAEVSVFLGYARELQYHEIRLGRLLKVTDKILMKGENTLLDLKESFKCPMDFEFDSSTCDQPGFHDLSQNKYPSSFFFIHDTFYIHSSPPNAKDLSKPIRMWAEKRSMIGPMKVTRMEETKIASLMGRLGQPYVYVHQGTCEHLVCINDVWLRSPSDYSGPYPLKLRERSFKRVSCAACKENTSEWKISECNILPTSPTYLCYECYSEFMFDHNGNKLTHFIVSPHLDRQVMDRTGVFMEKFKNNG